MMMRLFSFLIILLVALPAMANSARPDANTVEEQLTRDIVRSFFTEEEKDIIRDYFEVDLDKKEYKHKKGKKKKKGLPPGLAKKDKLPPGLQKQLEKNGKLPSGLAKRDLPRDLRSRLSTCKEKALECNIVGSDVILVEASTQIVRDILKDVLK